MSTDTDPTATESSSSAPAARFGLAGEHTIDDRILAQEQRFLARNRKSQELYERALRVMPGGVTSSWSSTRPIPVWVDRGSGSHVWDADGNEYVDYHAGYGVNVVGHANPAVVDAVQRRVTKGTHFAQPVEDAIVVAENLAERFGLPQWRFNNSGTEATMDAIHLMRAITGRDLVIKVEGTYHGHHDLVNVSLWGSIDDLGPVTNPRRVPGPGIPQAIADLVRIVPFNDLAAVERVFAEHPGQIAGMIIEPMMMNAGIIPPHAGYLEGLRQLVHQNGALLTFDEVKTGLVVASGGATELFGVTPDIICLAKALGGGVPCGAVGGTDEVMSAISDGRYDQVGTFNGNPLTMAAAQGRVDRGADTRVVWASRATRSPDVRGLHRRPERSRTAVLRCRARLQGFGGGARPTGHELSRVSRHRHGDQPPQLPRPTQQRCVPGTLGEERVVDTVRRPHRRRRRPAGREHGPSRSATGTHHRRSIRAVRGRWTDLR